jgi:hypothetical protein
MSSDENQTPVTPGQHGVDTTSFLHHQMRQDTFSDLNDEELQVLTNLAVNILHTRGILCTNISPPAPKIPDVFDNAKYEQIACTGIKPPYNESSQDLIPTLNTIHFHRQNEVWYSATFITQDGKTLDLIRHFSQAKQDVILTQTKALWDSADSVTQHHVRGTMTYNSRLFAVFLMNSITPDYATLLQSRIDPAYSLEGLLLFFTMCAHIHRNHLVFVESIKTKIRASSLIEFKDDVQNFLRFLQDNLHLITSTGASENEHKDLIPHILLQLCTTKIPIFQQSVLKWHRKYMENKLTLTPTSLVTMAAEECQVLKHSNQWVETIDPSILAMQAMVQHHHAGSAEIFHTMAAHFSEMSNKQNKITQDINKQSFKERNSYHVTPDWLYERPTDLTQSKYFNGRHWYFCTKCGHQGRWVCTHSDDTHRSSRNDGQYDNHRCRDDYQVNAQRGCPYDNYASDDSFSRSCG